MPYGNADLYLECAVGVLVQGPRQLYKHSYVIEIANEVVLRAGRATRVGSAEARTSARRRTI
jgi:hypothetical protein